MSLNRRPYVGQLSVFNCGVFLQMVYVSLISASFYGRPLQSCHLHVIRRVARAPLTLASFCGSSKKPSGSCPVSSSGSAAELEPVPLVEGSALPPSAAKRSAAATAPAKHNRCATCQSSVIHRTAGCRCIWALEL